MKENIKVDFIIFSWADATIKANFLRFSCSPFPII